MAKAKSAGPASVMVLLGFELDSAVRLSADKLECTIQLMREWRVEWLHLLGHLQHAATVVRSGCTFMFGSFSLFFKLKY